MRYLPIELISAIAKDLSSEDLRQLRATDKRFKDVAEPGAFRQVKITNTSKSIDGLLHLLNADHLRGLVEVLEFEEGPRPSDSGAVRYIPPDPVASTEADNELHQQMQAAFTQLHRCPHLESLQFTFRETYDVPVFDDNSACCILWARLPRRELRRFGYPLIHR
ncbi:hypothetical protein PENSPDRAFT_666997 [Peniophora sp. CONT]|nr:hypothetical protein PENSPDRAFT_666997 [Peniophora sp. CONT]